MPNLKSDVDAKNALRKKLLADGYESADIKGSPADVVATKGGEEYYFEVKYTRQADRYFGAATLTEWVAAIRNEARFWFVIAAERDAQWAFTFYTPEEFMKFSYIPPFKVYFNVMMNGPTHDRRGGKWKSAVGLTKEHLTGMSELFERMRVGAQPNAARPNAPKPDPN